MQYSYVAMQLAIASYLAIVAITSYIASSVHMHATS